MDSQSPLIPHHRGLHRWCLPIEWLALFLGVCLLLQSPLGMDDFFYQTRSGEYLVQTGHVLTVNLFSFTAPDHPWVNHAWLSGLLFHFIHAGLGLPGILVLNAACYLAAGLLFARNLRRCGAGPVARLLLLLVYAGVLAKPYAVVRPWMFSHILFQCLLGLWLVSREEADARTVRRRLAAGVLIVGLWLNLHGSFYVGLLMFLLQLAALRFPPASRERQNPPRPALRTPALLLWAVLAIAILFLNPYGTAYLAVPFQFLRGAVGASAGAPYLAYLEEWASVLSFSLCMDYLCAALGMAILVSIVVKAFHRQIRFSDGPRLVFFVASTALVLVAHRNDYFFLTANLCLFYPRREEDDGVIPAAADASPGFLNRLRSHLDSVPPARVVAGWFFLPCVVFLALAAAKPSQAFLDPAFWPPRLLAHLERDPFYREHHGLWDFDFSNIPIYRSDLRLKTFYDLREYCYPDGVTRDFLAFHWPRNDARAAAIQRWDLRYLVVRKGTLLDAATDRFLKTPGPYLLNVRFEDAASRIYEISKRPPDMGRF